MPPPWDGRSEQGAHSESDPAGRAGSGGGGPIVGPMRRRHDSALRDALIGVMVTVGPFFGVRYQPPRVEIPVVMSPAPDDLDPGRAAPVGDTGASAADGDAVPERR